MQSRHWYADGTFKDLSINLQSALYNSRGRQCGVGFAGSCPSAEQAKETCIRLMAFVRGYKPLYISSCSTTADFEMATMGAISTVHCNSRNRDCFFDFCRCIFREIQLQGLQPRYSENKLFAFICAL